MKNEKRKLKSQYERERRKKKKREKEDEKIQENIDFIMQEYFNKNNNEDNNELGFENNDDEMSEERIGDLIEDNLIEDNLIVPLIGELDDDFSSELYNDAGVGYNVEDTIFDNIIPSGDFEELEDKTIEQTLLIDNGSNNIENRDKTLDSLLNFFYFGYIGISCGPCFGEFLIFAIKASMVNKSFYI